MTGDGAAGTAPLSSLPGGGHNCFELPSLIAAVSPESSDPTVIRSVAVTVEDLVSALEMNRTSTNRAVLRITPPFSGRMRARLHVELDEEYDQQPRPIHVDPDELVEDPPSYPRAAETEDELRSDPERTYSVDRHHEYHTEVVERWRESVPAALKDCATIGTPAGPTTVDLSYLGADRSRRNGAE